MARPDLRQLIGRPDIARGLLTDFAMDLTEAYHPDAGLPSAEHGLEWSMRLLANRLSWLSWDSRANVEIDGDARGVLARAALAAAVEGSHHAAADTAVGRTMSIVRLRVWPSGLRGDENVPREAQLELNDCALMGCTGPYWAVLLQQIRDHLQGHLSPGDDATLLRFATYCQGAR